MPESASVFPSLTTELRDAFVAQVARSVRELYVFEDKANAMADHLLAQQSAGAFDEVESIPKLAELLTSELHGVHEDLHMYIAPWLPPSDASGEPEGNLHEDMLKTKHWTNFDFRKLEILLGNIGYMDLRMFCPVRISGETAAAAMQFLAHSDALIFDLRDNGGGEDLVQFLQSYLFAEPQHMITQRHRSGRIRQTWTHPFVPGPKFVEHAVYILMSRSTFSAAEDFAFTLQRQKRAVIVGEQTRGGAHPVEFYRFPELFLEIMIPEEYSQDPVSGENWESTGVVPDIEAHADDALQVAHAEALKKLLGKPEEEESLIAFRRWALESVEAQGNRPTLSPDQLRLYAGNYGRSVRVFPDRETLKLSWGGRRDLALLPLREAEFEFDHGTQRAQFVIEDGVAKALICRQQDGEEWRLPRKP